MNDRLLSGMGQVLLSGRYWVLVAAACRIAAEGGAAGAAINLVPD
jgi:hypothetical protein